jgi:hypothetical protein
VKEQLMRERHSVLFNRQLFKSPNLEGSENLRKEKDDFEVVRIKGDDIASLK